MKPEGQGEPCSKQIGIVNQKVTNRQGNAEKMNLVQAHDPETVKGHYA